MPNNPEEIKKLLQRWSWLPSNEIPEGPRDETGPLPAPYGLNDIIHNRKKLREREFRPPMQVVSEAPSLPSLLQALLQGQK